MHHRDPSLRESARRDPSQQTPILRLLATAFVAVSMAAGCDAIAEAEPDPLPEAEPEDAEPDVELGRDATPRDLAEATAALNDTCDAFAFEIGLFVGANDVDEVEAGYAEGGENTHRELDQDAMNACWVILTNGVYCESLRSGDLSPVADSPCNNLYPGTLAEGDTCDFAECSAGFHCPYSDVCSVCTRSSLEGEPCVSECDVGLICSWDSGDPICARPPPLMKEGDPCVEGERHCEPFGLTCFENVCTQRVAVAEGEQCDPGLFEGRRVCSPAGTFACFSVGDAAPTCNKVPGLGESCADSGYCDRAHCQPESSLCVDYVPVGGACEQFDCIQGSYCEGGTCIEFQSFQCTE